MKSPYRKGIQITVSNAAIHAAAVLTASAYKSPGPETAARLVNIASHIVDEIEKRNADDETPVEMPGVAVLGEAA